MAESIKQGVLELLVLQPSPFCNLDCDYCYLPSRQLTVRMSEEVLTRVFERTFESRACGTGFTAVWHAGEPLALPPSYYRRAQEIISARNTRGVAVSHSLQTNATLINPEWCELFKESGFRVGVSVDGPDFLHDRHRKTRSGRGTHAAVMRGIELLQKHEVPFHVISVLTRESLDYPDEIFDFFVEADIRQICFNVEEIEGPHLHSSLGNQESEQRFREFLSRFYDLAMEVADPPLSVREFDGALSAILGGESHFESDATQQTEPLRIISVDHLGNFSTFSPEFLGLSHERYPGFSFGNVMRESFDSMLSNQTFRTVHADLRKGVIRCKETCSYFPWCGGDGPVNKLFENGSLDSTETMYCRLSKMAVLDVTLDKLERKSRTLSMS